jgi:membrane protein
MTRTSKLIRRLARSTFEVLRDVARDYSAKRVSIVAAALAYYLFLALFPFVLVILAATGYIVGGSEHEMAVVRQALDQVLPASNLQIEKQLDTIIRSRAVVGGLGLLGLIWSASSAFAVLQQALRIVWGVQTRPRFLLVRLRALALLTLAIIFLLLSILATSLLPVVAHLPAAGVVLRLGKIHLLWRLGSATLSLAIGFITFLVLYRIVPASQVHLRHAAAGSAFAAIAWEIAKRGFAWYLHRFAHFDRIYGPVGAIVVLLLWIYISVVIVLIGAEMALVYSVRDRDHGHRG